MDKVEQLIVAAVGDMTAALESGKGGREVERCSRTTTMESEGCPRKDEASPSQLKALVRALIDSSWVCRRTVHTDFWDNLKDQPITFVPTLAYRTIPKPFSFLHKGPPRLEPCITT